MKQIVTLTLVLLAFSLNAQTNPVTNQSKCFFTQRQHRERKPDRFA